jgi:hypothetical protein
MCLRGRLSQKRAGHLNLCNGRSSEAGLDRRSAGRSTGSRRRIVTAGDGPVDVRFRSFLDREVADADQQINRSYQIVRYIGIPAPIHRIVIRTDAADLGLRAGRMVMLKVNVKETSVRMVIVLLMLMKMLKRRLEEAERQHERRQDGDKRPHRVILHTRIEVVP